MRKVYALSIPILLVLMTFLSWTNTASAQCVPRSSTFWGEALPNNGCAAFASYSPFDPGTYFRMPVLLGASYTISTCGATIDTQLTGFQGNTTTTSIFYNDDNGPDCSGVDASVTYVPTFTDYLRVNVNQYNCLVGGSASITLKVRQNNNLSFTSASSSMCQGAARSLTATPAPVASANTGAGDLGTFAGTGVSGTVFTAPTPAGASATYTQTYTFGYCSTSQTIDVFRNPSTANAGVDQTVCSSTASLGATSPAIGTGTWSVASGPGTVTNAGSPTSSVTGLSSSTPTVLYWTVSNGPCVASVDSVVITRDADPTAAIAGPDQTVCTSNTTLAGNTPSVGTGSWSLVGGSGTVTTPSSPTSGVTGLGIGTNTFRWTVSNGTCVNSTDDVVITREAAPTTAAAGSDQDVCGTTATLAGNAAVSGTGSWSVIAGSATVTTTSDPTSGVTGLSVGTNTFVWAITNGSCPPSTDTVTINRFDPPSAANAGPDQTVCGADATFAGNTPSTGTGTWTLVGGSGTIATPNDPTSTVTGLGVGPNTFRWTISSGPCTATTDDVVITGNPLPSMPSVSGNSDVCEGEVAMLTAVSGPGLDYNWYDTDTGTTPIGMGSNLTAGPLMASDTFYVGAVDTLTGCVGMRTMVAINVNPAPVAPVVSNDTTICPDETIPSFMAWVDSTSTVDWYDDSTGGNLLSAGDTMFTPTAGGTYYAESRDTGTGCVSLSRSAVSLNVRATASSSFTWSDANCPQIDFTDASTGPALSYSWDFGDGNTASTPNASNTYAANGTYTITFIVTDSCGSDTSTQDVDISCIVGIEEADVLSTQITVYPNPNTGMFTINFADFDAQELFMEVVDLSGRVLLHRELSGRYGDFETDVDLGNQSKGIYFVKIHADGQVATKKVIVQ